MRWGGAWGCGWGQGRAPVFLMQYRHQAELVSKTDGPTVFSSGRLGLEEVRVLGVTK